MPGIVFKNRYHLEFALKFIKGICQSWHVVPSKFLIEQYHNIICHYLTWNILILTPLKKHGKCLEFYTICRRLMIVLFVFFSILSWGQHVLWYADHAVQCFLSSMVSISYHGAGISQLADHVIKYLLSSLVACCIMTSRSCYAVFLVCQV